MRKFPGIPVGNFIMANSREFPVIPERAVGTAATSYYCMLRCKDVDVDRFHRRRPKPICLVLLHVS